ncbi:MAG: VWA domain-containing protein [Thermoguttaceae bacterium]|nr:VWA domain-containing protein [Thermoguttaceae bacterium]
MRQRVFHCLFVLAAVLATCSAFAQDAKPAEKKETPRAEVVFVLDSTGSMSGLIEGAKQKIWSIANSIISQDPAPEIKIGLISYRDKGDEYVTQIMDLTDDIDAVYAKLQSFTAAGGGDTPESVNQALNEAVTKMSWSPADQNVYRVIFLVGDCPPHMDYQDDVKYPETCKLAMEKFIIINTVQCGNYDETTPIWQDIAKKSEGQFVQIAQTGGMIVIRTPYDDDIAKLTKELSSTVIPYGSMETQATVLGKLRRAESADVVSNASRAAYNVKSKGRAVQGKGDLVQSLADDDMALDAVEEAYLPEDMKGLSKDELEKVVKEKTAKRAELNAKILDLSKKRDTWLAENAKKIAAERKAHIAADRASGARFSGRKAPRMEALGAPRMEMLREIAPAAAAPVPAYEFAAPAAVPAMEAAAEMVAPAMEPAMEEDADSASFDDSVSDIISNQMKKKEK